MTYDERRFLVTGGAGFIGSHLVTELLARGASVTVIDDFSTGKGENLDAAVADAADRTPSSWTSPAERLSVVEGSILDRDLLFDVVASADAVLHQAAIPSVPRSFADPVASMRANAEGTTMLLEACRQSGVRRMAMASSSSVYGDTPTLPKEESMPPSPMSPYALSKLAAELAGGIFARTYGLSVVALRYFNVFGPRQDPGSQYSAVIPKFASRMLRGEAPVIFGDGLQSRDFTFIADVVAANLAAVGLPPHADEPAPERTPAPATATPAGGGGCRVLNVGCGGRHTLLELVSNLNEIIGTDLEPEHSEPRPGDVRHSHASIDRARRELGFAPRVSFEEGLRRTVKSLRLHAETPSPAC